MDDGKGDLPKINSSWLLEVRTQAEDIKHKPGE